MISPTEINGAVVFMVKAVPRSSKSEIVGAIEGALKIRIAAPPIDSAANEELVKLLSKFFGVSKSRIEIIGGENSKTKRIKIADLSGEKFLAILQAKI